MLAARFAAKEAFYKALCSFISESGGLEAQSFPPFLRVCKNVYIKKSNLGIPRLKINWGKIGLIIDKKLESRVSISHDSGYSLAFVLLY